MAKINFSSKGDLNIEILNLFFTNGTYTEFDFNLQFFFEYYLRCERCAIQAVFVKYIETV
jgi:hypothetical protein